MSRMAGRLTLVCFAVPEEAKPFQSVAAGRPNLRVLVTGIGPWNAEKALRQTLSLQSPELVLTCGFAGGLNSALVRGAVLFAAEPESTLAAALQAAGAQAGRFHWSDRVASTSKEKRELRDSTGADAVEMESEVIRAICREKKIPSATVRVVLDAVGEDLPLDFNELMTKDAKLDGFKLGLALARAPGKIPALLRLQRESREAAEALAKVLMAFFAELRPPE